MATMESVFAPDSVAPTTGTVANNASSAEIVIGKNQIFAFTSSGDCYLAFGNTGMAVASASNFPAWANSYTRWDMASQNTSIRIFNNSGATITYWILPLAR